MKKIILILYLVLGVNSNIFSQIEDKTVCIKHPDADNLENFLKANNSFFIEFKGVHSQVESFIENFKKLPLVKSCNKGKITGEFHGIQISFKHNITKSEFIEALKKAGAEYIKINNTEPKKL